MDPKLTGEAVIQLDRPCTIRYGNYSLFRLSRQKATLGGGQPGGGWSYHELLVYTWAMLAKEDLARFPDPEDLAEYITPATAPDIAKVVLEAIMAGTPDKEKKTGTSKRGPSAALPSA